MTAVADTMTRNYLGEARAATGIEQIRDLWRAARDAGHLTAALEAQLAAAARALALEAPPGLDLYCEILREWIVTGDYSKDELGALWDWCRNAAIQAAMVHMLVRGELWVDVETDEYGIPDVTFQLRDPRRRDQPRPRRHDLGRIGTAPLAADWASGGGDT